MYDDALNNENKFEMAPMGNSGVVSERQLEEANKWDKMAKSLESEQPEKPWFNIEGGDYKEVLEGNANREKINNEGLSGALALINYGLNAAARERGVEFVVQTIKILDISGSEDPIRDLFVALGIDTPEEINNLQEEDIAMTDRVKEFREGINAPSRSKSIEGARKAIEDMKELIAEVEGADPRYEELRAGAKEAGMGYFEFAVSAYGTQDLVTLFNVLAMQRGKVGNETEKSENLKEVDANKQEGNGNLGGDGGGLEGITDHEMLNPEIIQKNED